MVDFASLDGKGAHVVEIRQMRRFGRVGKKKPAKLQACCHLQFMAYSAKSRVLTGASIYQVTIANNFSGRLRVSQRKENIICLLVARSKG